MQKQTNKRIKRERALAFLRLRGVYNLKQIAILLDVPQATIIKHNTALMRLLGRLGREKQVQAIQAIADVHSGKYQTESVRSLTDHKMVSDLVAMDWAISEYAKELVLEEEQKAAEQERKETERQAVLEEVRASVDEITKCLDVVLALTPNDISTELDTAMCELTEAVIQLEEQTS